MISGFEKILSSALVAVALIFPFSVWGLNVFNGRLGRCNDHQLPQSQCFNEFENNFFEWNLLSSTACKNHFLFMNSFKNSFLTFY